MMPVFVDTAAWIALVDPREPHHLGVRDLIRTTRFPLITTDWVIVELLNYFSARGEFSRRLATGLVEQILLSGVATILAVSAVQFESARLLYATRPDKAWSLTDCASFVLMAEHGSTTAFTLDHHFMQTGFTVLPGLAP